MENKPVCNSVREAIDSFLRRKEQGTMTGPLLDTCCRQPQGAFRFQLKLPQGVPFEIEASTNLQHWSAIQQAVAEFETLEFVDADAQKFSHRFYRVQAKGVSGEDAVGYVSLTTPPGFSMIGNPLVTLDSRISALLPQQPEGTTFSKFDIAKFRLTNNAFCDGAWVNPEETLIPGEGGILCNPGEGFEVITFVGGVLQGRLSNPLPAGFAIHSSMMPIAGRLHLDLNFPVEKGDVVHIFDRNTQQYRIFNFDEKEWRANPPMVGMGESFWVGKAAPGIWTQQHALKS